MQPIIQTEQSNGNSTAPLSNHRSDLIQHSNGNRVEPVPVPASLPLQTMTFHPVMSIEDAVAVRDQIIGFVKRIMQRDQDYGVIPGTSTKPTLLKPGAEKLCNFFGLEPEYTSIAEEIDLLGLQHGGEPFYSIRYRCRLLRAGVVRGVGEGSCNSWESRYRYRDAKRKCPNCSAETILKSRDRDEWFCWAKRGGCGAVFGPGQSEYHEIADQKIGRVPNPDVADLINTIQKIAQKRALVPATLLATSGSEFFTQDIEDSPAHEPEPQPAVEPKPSRQRNTRAEQQKLAERRIAETARELAETRADAPHKPWSNRGEMRTVFAKLREIVGEVRYQEELALAGVETPANFTSGIQALDCYQRLEKIARGEVA